MTLIKHFEFSYFNIISFMGNLTNLDTMRADSVPDVIPQGSLTESICQPVLYTGDYASRNCQNENVYYKSSLGKLAY